MYVIELVKLYKMTPLLSRKTQPLISPLPPKKPPITKPKPENKDTDKVDNALQN